MEVQCIYCWITLGFVTVVMILSLMKNVSYFLKEKKQKGKIREAYQQCSPSTGEFFSEECPVYDNVNHHHQEMLNESCYEQMNASSQKSHSQISVSETQQTGERQMCYASLDHSVKKKHKVPRKTRYPTLGMDEDQPSRNSFEHPDSCIYLNSEQLCEEKKLSEDPVHEDPIRIFGIIHSTNDVSF